MIQYVFFPDDCQNVRSMNYGSFIGSNAKNFTCQTEKI